MAKKKGKYAGVTSKLPRLVPDDSAYVDKLEAVKDEILRPLGKDETEVDDLPEFVSFTLDGMKGLLGPLYTAVLRAAATRTPDGIALSANSARLALIYSQLRKILNEFESFQSQMNLLLESYVQLLVEQFEDEGVSNLNLDGIGSVRVQIEPFAVVKDREAFRKWCVENGLENSLMLPWATANAITKQYLLEGDAPPDGVEAFQKAKIVFTKD